MPLFHCAAVSPPVTGTTMRDTRSHPTGPIAALAPKRKPLGNLAIAFAVERVNRIDHDADARPSGWPQAFTQWERTHRLTNA